MNLLRLEAPPVLPVSLATAKAHLRIGDDEDALLTGYIAAATDEIEKYLGRVLVTQSWRLDIDAFPSVIELPLPPCQAVDGISYFDPDGVLRTVDPSAYIVAGLNGQSKAEISPLPGTCWPRTQRRPQAVSVTFVAGYQEAGSPSDLTASIPPAITAAILELTATRYEYRETVSTMNLGSLSDAAFRDLSGYKIWAF